MPSHPATLPVAIVPLPPAVRSGNPPKDGEMRSTPRPNSVLGMDSGL